MNRAQRRAQPQDKPVTMKYGHSQTHILVQFSQAVTDISLTPEQCDAMVSHLTDAKEKLAKYREAHG